jgi:hypothetical protein
MSAFSIDSIGPKHGSTVNVNGLRAESAGLMGGYMSLGLFVGGTVASAAIDSCSITLLTTSASYSVTGLSTDIGGLTPAVDVFCDVVASVQYPFALLSFSGLVDASGAAYTTTAYAIGSILSIAGTLPVLPELGTRTAISIVDAAPPSTGWLYISDAGAMTVGLFTPAALDPTFGPFCCMIKLA